MPVPWIPAHWMAPREAGLRTIGLQNEMHVDKYLDVKYRQATYDPQRQVYIFSDGVQATYDLTTVVTDRLEVHFAPDEEWAQATGHVRVLDPDADIRADDLKFSWLPSRRSASAKNVSIVIGHGHLIAQSADLTTDQWIFRGVRATGCPDIYWLRASVVKVTPGKSASISQPTLYVFGKRIIGVRAASLNLNPKTEGVGLPSVNLGGGRGLGLAWNAGLLVDPRTSIDVSTVFSRGDYPSLSFSATRSLLPPERIQSRLQPQSDLDERFRRDYLDNVEVANYSEEQDYYRTERRSISADSEWNIGVADRDYATSVSKEFEGVYESGGLLPGQALDGASYLAQVRVQRISELTGPFTTRGVFYGSLELPSKVLGDSIHTIGRVDAYEFAGKGLYGWGRGLAGLSFEPNPHVTLAGGVYGTAEHGTSQFRFDRPIGSQGVEVRADLNVGPTKLSVLGKWDAQLGWFDNELMLRQVAGCFEPYVMVRKSPSTFTLGVRMRLDEIYDILSKRKVTRSGKTIVSQPHEGHS